ncbi:restriction endonuclease subunit S [Microcystis aeruginosa CS-1036]|uniref:restriction endonuclease subunit S n=2 Tax=Microcystaceae TaxID=1890449 RepID=UPI00233020A2|nr:MULTISPECIES: restriction endonuclease subunit S [Microcystis]MDB9406734.1 restriction endonuclease subunit S [Microcystis sp. CS-574]MDB9545247.1 restriction endonuclease subunit S [Microcystis aeruginosa CS-1036]
MKKSTVFPILPLGKICILHSGGTPRRSNNKYYGGNIPWAKIADLDTENGIVVDTEEYITVEGLQAINNRIFPKGSILLAMYGSIGKLAIAGRDISCNQAILGIQIKDKEHLDINYLRLWLTSIKATLEFQGRGVTQQNISKSIVEKLEIPLPPLEEQRRIAAILDKADGVRRKRKEAIRLTEELLRSTFLEMFGDPVTNPKGWEIVKLGSLVVGQLNNGIFKKNHEYGGDTPVVWVKELFSGYTIDCSESRTLTPTDEEVKKFGLTKGDILFCRSSLNREGIGFNNVFDGMDFSALFECHIIRVSLNQRKVNSIFLNYLLRFPGLRKQIIAKANTVTMSTIGQSEIKKIEFYLPPKELQDKFEIFLRKIATNRTKLENKESENLFNSLLQRAFRGEL